MPIQTEELPIVSKQSLEIFDCTLDGSETDQF